MTNSASTSSANNIPANSTADSTTEHSDELLPVVSWAQLDNAQRNAVLTRPRRAYAEASTCEDIITKVRQQGDAAIRQLTRQLDGVTPAYLKVPGDELQEAWNKISAVQQDALQTAYDNISSFHNLQKTADKRLEPMSGIVCELQHRAVQCVGLYVPGGTAPLPSTVLMLGVPSLLAGCPERILCTPVQANGRVDPLVLAAADLCGIDQIFAVGGAQAVAAMAYGTETIPVVDKIYGPGNAWVTRAKQLVAQDPAGAGCDMPAGPSEVLVIADNTADAAFVASDLLSQAEHDTSSQCVLVTNCERQARQVRTQCLTMMMQLPRKEIICAALLHSCIIVTDSLEEAITISNTYAPEHLIINTRDARSWLPAVTNAGSVFLGPWSPEAVGDYCSGTNHVLPTSGYSRFVSGIGVSDFQKRISVQELSAAGLNSLAPTCETLATAEGLSAHALAVRLRVQSQAETP